MKKALLSALKIVVTVGLIFWLVERVDWQGVLVELKEISYPLLFFYVIFQLLGNVISAKKWQTIARFKGLSFSLKE